MDLLAHSCTIQRFTAFNATQAKEKSYHNWHPTNQFRPLTIEVFGCLHKHANVFLHNYANAIWSVKGTKSFYLSTLVTFLRKKVSIILQRMQVSSILSRAIVIDLTTSWLPPLQNTPPITTANLLQAISFWHINMADHPQAISYGHGEIFTIILNQLGILSFLFFPLFYSFIHFRNLRCIF
jgi:hypothetical protein